jgi:hypothetical protein
VSRTVVATKTLGTSEQVVINKYGDGSLEFQRLLKTTGTVANGSPTITSVASTNGIAKGNPISGTGIPAGATVVSFVANTSITISANATADGAAEAITINKTPNLPNSRTTDSGPTWEKRLVDHLLATN